MTKECVKTSYSVNLVTLRLRAHLFSLSLSLLFLSTSEILWQLLLQLDLSRQSGLTEGPVDKYLIGLVEFLKHLLNVGTEESLKLFCTFLKQIAIECTIP